MSQWCQPFKLVERSWAPTSIHSDEYEQLTEMQCVRQPSPQTVQNGGKAGGGSMKRRMDSN